MKHFLTASEASIILETLEKIKKATRRSPVMASALDITRHEIAKCEAVIKKLEQ